MDMKMCATSDVAKEWDKIDWNKANAYVKKLQMRIVKAHQEGKHGRVKSLQWLLTHSLRKSFSCKKGNRKSRKKDSRSRRSIMVYT